MSTKKSFSTNPDSAQGYIDTLQLQLDAAQGLYNTAKAEADKAEKEYARALAWETLIKGYKDAMEKTDRLAVDLIAGLDKCWAQTGKIAGLAEKSNMAFKWFLDDAITLAKCVEEYKCNVDHLRQDLTKADAKDPLIAGLDKLAQALAEAFDCVKQVLDLLLEVLKAGEAIAKQLGETGLKDLLFDISQDFKGLAVRYDWNANADPTDTSCPRCSAPEKPAFPLKDNNGAYWASTQAEASAIAQCLDSLWKKLDTASKKRDSAKACLDSLTAALKAAKEALACKN